MSNSEKDLARQLLAHARRLLRQICLPRITRCLEQLSEDQIWWRANPASNSVGNLALHLEGNVRQWIISGLGGAADIRVRDREFSEQGPLPRLKVQSQLRMTVYQACRVLGRMSSQDLMHPYRIQGFRVSGLKAVFHVSEHFSHHTGQIILLTKLLTGRNLSFTHLPGDKKKPRRSHPSL